MAPNNSCSTRKSPPSIDDSFLLAPCVGSHLQLAFHRLGAVRTELHVNGSEGRELAEEVSAKGLMTVLLLLL